MDFIELKVTREFCDYANSFVSEIDPDDEFMCGSPETEFPYCDDCPYFRLVEETQLCPRPDV